MAKWKTLSSRVVHKNQWFKIRKDRIIRSDGRKGIYYVMDRPSCVTVVPMTEKNEVYLIYITRYTTHKAHWEVPIGGSDNQNELTAAKRELMEETGLTSDSWLKTGETEVANGMTGQMAHHFIARKVKQLKEAEMANEEGILKMQKFPFKKVMQMIKNNEIVDNQAITAIIRAGLKLNLI